MANLLSHIFGKRYYTGAAAQCCLSDSYTSHRNSDDCGLSARGFAPSFHKMTI